jgi:hypothetical protein
MHKRGCKALGNLALLKLVSALQNDGIETYSETGVDLRQWGFEVSAAYGGATRPHTSGDAIHPGSPYLFLRIRGVPLMADGDGEGVENQRRMTRVFSELYRTKTPFSFLIKGMPEEINVSFVVSKGRGAMLSSLLEASFPGISIEHETGAQGEICGGIEEGLTRSGLVTGVPFSAQTTKENRAEGGLQSIIRGMKGEHWWIMFTAVPMAKTAVSLGYPHLLTESGNLEKHIAMRRVVRGEDERELYEKTTNISVAQVALKLLRMEASRLSQVKSRVGGWWVCTFFGSDTQEGYTKLRAMIESKFSDENHEESVYPGLEPLRCTPIMRSERELASAIIDPACLRIDKSDKYLDLFTTRIRTWLTSSELSCMANFPEKEVSGFSRGIWADFATDVPPELSDPSDFLIGAVRDQSGVTNNTLHLPERRLCKHVQVGGMTGYGKTVIVKRLLMRLSSLSRPIPWLVIEPSVKSEYPSLVSGLKALGIRPLVFTLGKESFIGEDRENTYGFRLNPFEVPNGVSVETHIGGLVTIFEAGFPILMGMEPAFERMLYALYRDCGWHVEVDTGGIEGRRVPTLEDFIEKVRQFELEYPPQGETVGVIKGGLVNRFLSLTETGLGAVLNCPRSIPIEEILSKPTVLLLRGIGNQKYKSFVMSILFQVLTEYRQSRGPSRELQHITVIEEAHRLFRTALATRSSEEKGAPATASIETFCEWLAEQRAFGEGIVVVEQSATKLPGDVLKNTSTQIFFKTKEGIDRRAIADAVGLKERQRDYLGRLVEFEAICSVEGAQRPFLVKTRVEDFPTESEESVQSEITTIMNTFFFSSPYVARKVTRPNSRRDLKNDRDYILAIRPLLTRRILSEIIYTSLKREGDDLDRIRGLLRPLLVAVEGLGLPAEDMEGLTKNALRLFLMKARYDGPDKESGIQRLLERFVEEYLNYMDRGSRATIRGPV